MAASWRLIFFLIFRMVLWNLVYIGDWVCESIGIVRFHVRLGTRLRRPSRVYLHCPFSCAIQNEAIAAILILPLVFYYWYTVLAAVVSDLLPWFLVTASAEGCLSAYTVFFVYLNQFRGLLKALVNKVWTVPLVSGPATWLTLPHLRPVLRAQHDSGLLSISKLDDYLRRYITAWEILLSY